MKLYRILIRPTSGLGTPLKGDTLFGQFCWQVRYDDGLLEGGLEKGLSAYLERPFLIFSSAFPVLGRAPATYAWKRPDAPLSLLFPDQGGDRLSRGRKAKVDKKKKWMLVGEDLRGLMKAVEYVDDAGLARRMVTTRPGAETIPAGKATRDAESPMRRISQPHNSIDRHTWTTGTGAFAPFTTETTYYLPGTRLGILALVDTAAVSMDKVALGLGRIGLTGYGKDASTGKGRFEVESWEEAPVPDISDVNACYCLAPCLPAPDSFERASFTPFVRYGKHGDYLASSAAPFKTPVIMADEGAIFVPKDRAVFERLYFGCGIKDISRTEPATVMQGYAVCIPMKLEGVS